MYAYGLTSLWTLAFRIGVVNTSTDLTDNSSSSGHQMGTAEVINKQSIMQKDHLGVALYEDVKFPSAQIKSSDYDVNNLPDPSGFGLGVGSSAAYQIAKRWQARVGTLLVYNFDDSVATQESLAGTTHIQKLHRQPGADFVVNPSLAFDFKSPFQMTLGWLWQAKGADSISSDQSVQGDQFESESLAVFGLGLKPGAYEFSRNWQLGGNINYYALLAGHNVADANTLGLDLQVVF
jgi:hypothetical protein